MFKDTFLEGAYISFLKVKNSIKNTILGRKEEIDEENEGEHMDTNMVRQKPDRTAEVEYDYDIE